MLAHVTLILGLSFSLICKKNARTDEWGGIAGTMLSVAGLGVFFNFDVLMMAILGLFICLVATLGDLVESIMKRYTGIKDSGNIIPGHGGVWDRFDSVMFTVPFVYYFMQIAAVR